MGADTKKQGPSTTLFAYPEDPRNEVLVPCTHPAMATLRGTKHHTVGILSTKQNNGGHTHREGHVTEAGRADIVRCVVCNGQSVSGVTRDLRARQKDCAALGGSVQSWRDYGGL